MKYESNTTISSDESIELNRQCKMAWERGYDYGRVTGFTVAMFSFIFVSIIIRIIF